MRVTTADVLLALAELAELTTLDEGSPQSFRARAYENARRGIEAAAADVRAMSPEELVAIEGVGPSIAAAISELVATGTAAALERLRAAYPPGVVAVSRVPGTGPKTLALRDRLGVEDPPGVGPAREARIARALARLAPDRVPAAVALPIAERLAAEVAAAEGVESCTAAGSLRRMAETGEVVDRGRTRSESSPRPVSGSTSGSSTRSPPAPPSSRSH